MRIEVPSRGWLLVAFSLGACASGSDSDGTTVDPGFDQWCGSFLCDWTTDEGAVEPTGTWHRKDLAVSFLTTPSRISQRVQGSAEQACFLVDTLADVDPEARLSLKLDFNDDETIDLEQQFVDVGWKSVPLVVKAPLSYESVRFIVRKEGQGRAVLALLRVEALRECAGDPVLLRDGSRCTVDGMCQSGRCRTGQCSSLAADAGSE